MPTNRARFVAIFCICFAVMLTFSYGGIRSPDGELMFRTAESLVDRYSFSIEELESWPGFGVARGINGDTWAWYGPGLPIVGAPLVVLGKWVAKLGWWEHLNRPPISHYEGEGLTDFVTDRRPVFGNAHAVRAVSTLVNVVVGALSATVFFAFLLQQRVHRSAALAVTALFALGTTFFVYTGTYFCEPLATLFTLLSLKAIENRAPDLACEHNAGYLSGGLWLGAAFATHVTSVLWAPFFLVLALHYGWRERHGLKTSLVAGCKFLAGFVPFIILLGLFNLLRFGSVMETGRPVGNFALHTPWHGIEGLLASGGKGLIFFCPAAIAGLFAFYWLIRLRPWFGMTLLVALIMRVVLIGGFYDWHGGFGMGPRYLVPALPLFLLPLGLVADRLARSSLRGFTSFLVFVTLCISQQGYFASGEVFSFQHQIKWSFLARNINIFENDRIYFDWALSPCNPAYLLQGRAGPLLFRILNWSPAVGWMAWNLVLGCSLACLIYFLRKSKIGGFSEPKP